MSQPRRTIRSIIQLDKQYELRIAEKQIAVCIMRWWPRVLEEVAVIGCISSAVKLDPPVSCRYSATLRTVLACKDRIVNYAGTHLLPWGCHGVSTVSYCIDEFVPQNAFSRFLVG